MRCRYLSEVVVSWIVVLDGGMYIVYVVNSHQLEKTTLRKWNFPTRMIDSTFFVIWDMSMELDLANSVVQEIG